ncbi:MULTISPECIES: hypothetical protein [unclassified Streptomyces]|uniref:hypothetical protein n=1 Tax=unclassified Streptomyces TaxID=2593676 RepID=UPI00225832B0|nr:MULTISPECIES: hypothetical protein [unclassified Streptomyces]WSP60084.1 hypothetical protein OG306_18075 [Streptomyces sp. NBC_01241]WSU26518.1 hypothetical protein OG508_21245 [Streptomyces sp. NBC_01108]MCX4787773.1 hypothetical protein [Streptomyces sp. NBC_01221]MCX4796463.1 hypothetical protein [Streptomyces sp. NBC_01242]WSJ41099.1 hypothetical protein OG772_17830 [Streptomyces sp. NBC_01321]
MKKIIMLATLPLAIVGMAAPAHADNDSNFGSGVNAANNWNFTESVACLQEVAAVPVIGDWVGDHTNNCSNGNMIDHALES